MFSAAFIIEAIGIHHVDFLAALPVHNALQHTSRDLTVHPVKT
jgi:hypothetical protein